MLLQILWAVARHPLRFDHFFCFFRSADTPKSVECVHVEGHVVELALVIGDRGIDEVVEFAKLLHVRPGRCITCAENVSAINMYVDAIHAISKAIAANMVAFFNYEHLFAAGCRIVGNYGTKKAASDYEKIIRAHLSSFPAEISDQKQRLAVRFSV